MRFTRDPLDETIAEDVFGRHHATYFPEVPDGFEPKLVLDLGAHHGQYSLVATLEYPGANVIAVEPGPDQATALRRNVQLNQLDERITVLESALSDASGDAALHLDSDGSWGNTLFEPSGDGGAVTVRTSTLSQILGGRVPDVVKCNAEGAEYALIQQLDSIEPKPGLLVLMVHDEHGDVRALEEAIGMMGYEVNTVMVGDHPTWHCTLDS
jgi:FkbM family methyltransferase